MASKEDAREAGKEMAELFLPFLRTDVPDSNLWRLALKFAKWDAMPQMAGNVDLALEYAASFVSAFQPYKDANVLRAIEQAKRKEVYGDTTPNG